MNPTRYIRQKSNRRIDAQQAKNAVDIVGLVMKSVQLRRSGSVFRGLCPFHEDKVPSLVVNPDTQTFHCFGCQARGDAIDWVQMLYSVDFRMALEQLTGLREELAPAKVRSNSIIKLREKRPVPMEVVDYWHGRLEGHRDYFRGRLFADWTMDAERWGWTGDQYAIPIWDGSAQNNGKVVQVKFRRDSQLVRQRLQEEGFEGEELEEALRRTPRYTCLTGHGSWLYDAWKAKGAKTIFLFFGELDAALFNQDFVQSGDVAACSPTGGKGSWDDSWQSIFRQAEEVIVVPDKGEEEEGHKLAARIGGHAKVMPFTEGMPGKDYCEFRQTVVRAQDFLRLAGERKGQWKNTI